MNRSKESVVAVYGGLAEAKAAIGAMNRSGFPATLVSLVSGDLKSEADAHGESLVCHHELPAKCPRTCQGSVQCAWSGACVPRTLQFGDNTEKDAAIGAGAGGLLGLVFGVSVLLLTKGEIAFLFGPVSITAAIVGAFLGAMVGWGVHSDQLGWYGRKVRAGKALLLVHGSPLEVARAKRLLRETHPAELHLHAETSADAYEIHPRE